MDRRSYVALLTSTALAGCNGVIQARGEADITAPTENWAQFRGGPQRRGYADSEYSFDQGTKIQETDRVSVSSLVLDGDTAIVPTESSLVGLNLEDLSVDYEIEVESVPTVPPARSSSVVTVATSDNVAGYNVESQSRVWTLPARDTYDAGSAPAALGSHFVVQDGNRIRLVERESGSVVWSREFDARVEGFAGDEDQLVVNRNTSDESEFVALDPSTGETEWSVTVESSRLHPVVGRSVFALSEYGRLIAIEGGEVQWTVETGALNPKSIAVTNDFVAVVSESTDRCVGVEIDEESVGWKSKLEFGESVIATDDRAFVSSANTGVVELDITTGERIRVFDTARFAGSLVPFTRGLLYTHRSNDRVYLIGGA